MIKPTRITDHSATLRDNIYFNSVDHQTISGNLVCNITDHLPNFLIIDQLRNNTKNRRYKRNHSNINSDKFIADAQSLRWEEVFPDESDINDLFSSFHNKISEVIDRHVPLKRLSKREARFKTKPWITNGLKICIAMKNKLYKYYLNRETNIIYLSLNTIGIN
jgi:hypothetical protein